jgi:type VI protein secretion system component VasK
MKQRLRNHPFFVYLILFRGVCAVGLLFVAVEKGFWEILLASAVFLAILILGEGVFAGLIFSAIAEEARQKKKEAERSRREQELKKREDFVGAQKTSTKEYIQVTNYIDAAGKKTPLKGGKATE